MQYIPIKKGAKNTMRGGGVRYRTALLLKMYIFSNLNLRNNLRKTEGGGGGNGKPEALLEENKEECIWSHFSEGKTKRT